MTDRPRRGGGRPDPPDHGGARVTPQDLDAEEAVLGAMLLRGHDVIEPVTKAGLEVRDFWKPAHAAIYDAILRLDRAGDPVDPITVAGAMSAGDLELIGGPATLMSLQAGTPATSNAARYARQILGTSGRRRMLELSAAVQAAAYDDVPLNGEVAKISALADQHARGWRRDGMHLQWGEPETPPAPQPVLVDGLLRVGELCVFAAPRAIGKSTVAYNLAKLLAEGHGSLFGKLDILRPARVLIAQGEIEEWQSHHRWRRLGGKPTNVAETWEQWRIRVDRTRRPISDGGWIEQSLATLDPHLEDAIEAHGVEVLIVDPWRTYYAGAENSNDETEAALNELTQLSRRTGVALVIVHHISGKAGFETAAEPEDMWRGASRLADWASTRVTILPHYTARSAEEAGLNRTVARRHVDVYFLRRAEPTADLCAVMNEQTGWFEHWAGATPGEGRQQKARRGATGSGQPGGPGLPDVGDHYLWLVEALARDGGTWTSLREAAFAIGKSSEAAAKLLSMAVRHGLLDEYKHGNSRGFRLPSNTPAQLPLDDDPDDPGPNEPPAGGDQ
jgi:hypothetical protein